jgi:mannosyltransferase OCH1-like enzyme
VLFETYWDLEGIPPKVAENRLRFASTHQRILLDDVACEKLVTSMLPERVSWWRSIVKGAHRTDVVRALLLLRYGGAYCDIKTELLVPLDQLLPSNCSFCSVINSPAEGIPNLYNGILSVRSPGHPLLRDIIDRLCKLTPEALEADYHLATKTYRAACDKYLGTSCLPGLNVVKDTRERLLFRVETCDDPAECHGPDKYDGCFIIRSADGEALARTRYPDYPWAPSCASGKSEL